MAGGAEALGMGDARAVEEEDVRLVLELGEGVDEGRSFAEARHRRRVGERHPRPAVHGLHRLEIGKGRHDHDGARLVVLDDDVGARDQPDRVERERRRDVHLPAQRRLEAPGLLDIHTHFDLEVELQLATRPEKSVGGDEIWEQAESQLRAVLENQGIDYDLEPGDGAFYGPKIDFAFEDALGRDWDGPTVQLDFNMPERFDLTYTGADNEEHRPVMIHRALYGSYERFFMVLIEHFNGKFPLWLAPEQVRILPVSDDNLGYSHRVKNELEDAGFRVEVEDRSWTVGRKIQDAHADRVPYMLILGGNEEEAGTISVRDRKEREDDGIQLETFKEHLISEREEKRTDPDFLDD